MHNSDSDFFIYNSTGRLLVGEKEGYSNEYSNLAKQIDSKRNALYFELTENASVLILGCSVMVEHVGGREERIVCVAKYVNYSGQEKTLIWQFYEKVLSNVRNIQKLDYRIIGLWEKDDINSFNKVNQTEPDKYVSEFILGKLITNEKVSIRTDSSRNAILIIDSSFQKLVDNLKFDFKFTASQYPYESDISIGPIEPNPDFELNSDELKFEAYPRDVNYYIHVSHVLNQKESEIPAHFSSKDRNEFSFNSKKAAYDNYKDKLLDSFSDPRGMSKLVELYRDNSQALSDIIKEKNSLLSSMPLESKLTVAKVIIRQYDHHGPYASSKSVEEDSSLNSLYINLHTIEEKRQFAEFLLSRNVLLFSAIKDIITYIYNEESQELLLKLCSINLSAGSERGKKLKKQIKSSLELFSDDNLIYLLKFIANNTEISSSAGGKILLKSIEEKLIGTDISSNLTTKEAKNLDQYFGTTYASKKKSHEYSELNIVRISSYILIAILLISVVAIFLIPGDVDSSNNSSNNSSFVDKARAFTYSLLNISDADGTNTMPVNDSANESVNSTSKELSNNSDNQTQDAMQVPEGTSQQNNSTGEKQANDSENV